MMEDLSALTGEDQFEEKEVASPYPKRLILRPDQWYRERWERYFEDQYHSECARLGLIPNPKQETLL